MIRAFCPPSEHLHATLLSLTCMRGVEGVAQHCDPDVQDSNGYTHLSGTFPSLVSCVLACSAGQVVWSRSIRFHSVAARSRWFTPVPWRGRGLHNCLVSLAIAIVLLVNV